MFYEDFQERFGKRRWEPLTIVMLCLLSAGACGLLIGTVQHQSQLMLASAALVTVMLIAFAWRGTRGQEFPCPNCQGNLDPLRRQAVIETRACPLCLHVFPSRLPPQMRSITFERDKLPRIWLQGEVTVATPADAVEDGNPYRASSLPTTSSETTGPTTGTLGCLWGAVKLIGQPVLLLATSDEELLASPHLPERTSPETERARRLRRAYLLTVRRQAWVQLPCLTLAPLGAAGYVGWTFAQRGFVWEESLLMGVSMAILALGMTLVIGALFYNLLSRRAPRFILRWLQGGLDTIDADAEATTGYYGLRWRVANVPTQQGLPRIKFRVRQAVPGELQLRVVHQDSATALELPLACPVANQWQRVDVDIRWLVRQSDPRFLADELHLTSAPDARLEICDYEVVTRV
ncbi:MAG TPA: hypothetical protein VL096_04390 [Pirellulaceae bacterium]|nr:hypothetical protein [Pirellulaceae bacterium]